MTNTGGGTPLDTHPHMFLTKTGFLVTGFSFHHVNMRPVTVGRLVTSGLTRSDPKTYASLDRNSFAEEAYIVVMFA